LGRIHPQGCGAYFGVHLPQASKPRPTAAFAPWRFSVIPSRRRVEAAFGTVSSPAVPPLPNSRLHEARVVWVRTAKTARFGRLGQRGIAKYLAFDVACRTES